MNLFDKLPEVPANAFVAPSAAVIGDVQIGQRSSVWYNAILRGDVNSIRVGADTNIQDGCIVHVAKTNLAGKILPTIIGSRVTVGEPAVAFRATSSHFPPLAPRPSPSPPGHNAVLHACTVEDEAFVGIQSEPHCAGVPRVTSELKTPLPSFSPLIPPGHNAVLHACTVEDEAFVGIGATLLDGVVVESGAMVAAGALVVQNTRIPSGQVGPPLPLLENSHITPSLPLAALCLPHPITQIWAGSPAKFFRTLTAAEQAFIAKSAESYASLAEVHAKENAKSFEEVEADKKQREGWANYSEDFVSSVGAVVDKPPVPGPVKLA
ncbi:unnamed protein product [Closterium sp. NIES-53]